MSATHRSGGNRFSHEVGTGYRNASRFSSKWERPEGDLHWLAGGLWMIFIAVAGLGLTLAFGQDSDTTPAAIAAATDAGS